MYSSSKSYFGDLDSRRGVATKTTEKIRKQKKVVDKKKKKKKKKSKRKSVRDLKARAKFKSNKADKTDLLLEVINSFAKAQRPVKRRTKREKEEDLMGMGGKRYGSRSAGLYGANYFGSGASSYYGYKEKTNKFAGKKRSTREPKKSRLNWNKPPKKDNETDVEYTARTLLSESDKTSQFMGGLMTQNQEMIKASVGDRDAKIWERIFEKMNNDDIVVKEDLRQLRETMNIILNPSSIGATLVGEGEKLQGNYNRDLELFAEEQKRIIDLEKKLGQTIRLNKGGLRSEFKQAKRNQEIMKRNYNSSDVVGRNVLGKMNELSGIKLKEQVDKTLDIEIDVGTMGVEIELQRQRRQAVENGDIESQKEAEGKLQSLYEEYRTAKENVPTPESVARGVEGESVGSTAVEGAGVGGIKPKSKGDLAREEADRKRTEKEIAKTEASLLQSQEEQYRKPIMELISSKILNLQVKKDKDKIDNLIEEYKGLSDSDKDKFLIGLKRNHNKSREVINYELNEGSFVKKTIDSVPKPATAQEEAEKIKNDEIRLAKIKKQEADDKAEIDRVEQETKDKAKALKDKQNADADKELERIAEEQNILDQRTPNTSDDYRKGMDLSVIPFIVSQAKTKKQETKILLTDKSKNPQNFFKVNVEDTLLPQQKTDKRWKEYLRLKELYSEYETEEEIDEESEEESEEELFLGEYLEQEKEDGKIVLYETDKKLPAKVGSIKDAEEFIKYEEESIKTDSIISKSIQNKIDTAKKLIKAQP